MKNSEYFFDFWSYVKIIYYMYRIIYIYNIEMNEIYNYQK